MTRHRLLGHSILLVQVCRIVNALAMLLFVAALIGTLPGAEWIEAAVDRKYGGAVNTDTVIRFIQVTMLLGLVVGYAVERLFAALRAVLASVEVGDPFAASNAGRIRTIGWMLLVVQIADLGFGAATLIARHLDVEYVAWQPSLIGWIAVLVAFVLAQVFERRAAMRDDLDGTV